MRLWSAVVVCALAACATTPNKEEAPPPADAQAPAAQPAPPAPAQKPPPQLDIKELVARETQPAPAREVRSPDGTFTAQVEATGEPTFSAQGEGMHAIEIPVGTGSPLTCFTYKDRIDPAGALGMVVAPVAKAVEVQGIVPSDVKVIGESPVMFLRMEYLANTAQGRAFGQLKLAVSARPDVSFMCAHDEAGYHASFQRWVQGFAASLEGTAAPADAPRFKEIQVVKLNDQPVGFSERTVYAAPKGKGKVLETYSSLILPRTKSELLASDSFTREEVDGKGLIDSVTYVKSLNGEINANINLQRQKPGYAYKGTWERKPIDGTFTSKEPLAGDPMHWRLVKSFLAGKKDQLSVPSYSASTDPTGAVTVVYQKDPGPDGELIVELGPMKFSARADEHGIIEHTQMPMGRITMSADRIFSQGTP